MRSDREPGPIEIDLEELEQVDGGFNLENAADGCAKAGFAGLFGVEFLRGEHFKPRRLSHGAWATFGGCALGALVGGLYSEPPKKE